MNGLRFEKLGICDYLVYMDGYADAIGKAGELMGEAWFQPRADLGSCICWSQTMAGAVRAWAESELQIIQLQKMLIAQMVREYCRPDDEEEE